MKISLNPFLQNGSGGLSSHEQTQSSPFLARPLSRSLMKINLITLLLGLGLSQVDASTYAQQVTLKRQKTSLESILKDFEKQSGYTFFYKKTDISAVRGVDIDIQNVPLAQALNNVLKDNQFTFEYFDKTIVIKKSTASTVPVVKPYLAPNHDIAVVKQLDVKGKVLDENGAPIKGASIRLKSDPKNPSPVRKMELLFCL